MLKQGKVRVECVESLVVACNRSPAVYPSLLSRCIVATKSILFFDACESKFENSPENLIPIFESFYSKKIEQRLCHYFHKELQSKEPFLYFDSCICALTKNGRKLTLDTLEVLEFELSPKADLAKVMFAAIQGGTGGELLEVHELLRTMLDRLTIHRLAEIRESIAILQINARVAPSLVGFTSQTQSLPESTAHTGSREFEYVLGSRDEYARCAMERSEFHRENAEQLLALKRYADAGNNYRKSAEAILKAVFVIRLQNTKVPTLLDRLKTSLKSSASEPLPETIGSAIDVVHNIGNLASHDQSDDFFIPNEIIMNAVQDSLRKISNWAKSVIEN